MTQGQARVLAVAMVAAFAAPAVAQTIKEPSSGLTFKVHRQIQGRPYTCVGVGIRKVYVFAKVYAAGLYVDDESGKPAFQKLLAESSGDVASLKDGSRLHNWIITGDFGKAMEWVFTRDLEKGKMASTIRESLERELGDLGAPDLRAPTEKFLAAVDIPLKKWQRVHLIQRPGYEIVATLDARPIVKVKSKKIARAIWRIYFGPKPIQSDLKKNLLESVANLK